MPGRREREEQGVGLGEFHKIRERTFFRGVVCLAGSGEVESQNSKVESNGEEKRERAV